MANIGTFKKTGDNFEGEIFTVTLDLQNVRIVAEATVDSDNAPTHRVFVGRAEIGAAWAKTSSAGRNYLSVTLDDPSFTNAINANLFENDDGATFKLVWTRPRP